MARILIIDDDIAVCKALSKHIEINGHSTVAVHSVQNGREKASQEAFDVVFLDVMLPDGNGLDIIPFICNTPSNPEVIIITGAGNADGVELAIESGAWDYIEKSSSPKEMMFPLIRALQYREKKLAVNRTVAFNREGIIGNAPALNQCIDFLSRLAAGDSTVIISGETGTGKELFAHAIHKNSDRKNNLFVIVDCAALPETLVESVLFGHKKGAFTGAETDMPGLIKQADGGTLFLDEVGELPLKIQKEFLRALQERCFRPVGATREVTSDFRLLAATHRDLGKMVESGIFREDLFYRLKVSTIEVPTLRQRKDDIKGLAIHHVTRLCRNYHLDVKGFSPDFFTALESYDWPGNVRELFNAIDRAVTAAQYEPILFSKHLPKHIRSKIIQASFKKRTLSENAAPLSTQVPILDNPDAFPSIKTFRRQTEYAYLKKLMETAHGKKAEACTLSGLSRTRLFELLTKHNFS